jgi:hypothetical protein
MKLPHAFQPRFNPSRRVRNLSARLISHSFGTVIRLGIERRMGMNLSALLAMVMALVGCATSGGRDSRPSFTQAYKLHVIPGTIELEDFDEGGEGVAYHDLDPENQETKQPPYRKTGVDLEWREAASGKFNLGWTRPGEWLIYTVDVKTAGTYRIDMHVACKGPGGTFHLEFNGVDRTGPITVPDTGGWEHLKPFSHAGVKLTAGRQVMKVVMATGGKSGSIGDIDYLKFVKQ